MALSFFIEGLLEEGAKIGEINTKSQWAVGKLAVGKKMFIGPAIINEID
jgi:hypothetical protein